MTESSTSIKKSLENLLATKDFVDNISVDCTIFGYNDGKLKVLLLKYHGLELWSLPGGFVYNHEDLRQAAERVLFERTHLTGLFLNQFHTFGRINRTQNNIHQILLQNQGIEVPPDHWIFKRFVTVGYCSLIDYTIANTFPDAFNETCEWFDVDQLPPMAFDHGRIIKVGLNHLQKNLDTEIVAYNLLPEKFTMNQLMGVYKTVLNKTFRRNNFQRKMLSTNLLERMEKLYDGSANKAPYLYRFKESEINLMD